MLSARQLDNPATTSQVKSPSHVSCFFPETENQKTKEKPLRSLLAVNISSIHHPSTPSHHTTLLYHITSHHITSHYITFIQLHCIALLHTDCKVQQVRSRAKYLSFQKKWQSVNNQPYTLIMQMQVQMQVQMQTQTQTQTQMEVIT